ncbi:hypothetical protein [Xanthobacter sp.]|uniref:hypothetical protein n=1 Tax=Xanthobacter sp. TaxID=35809 RepID=UPI0035B09822
MSKISEEDFKPHMEAAAAGGFGIDPPGYERLTQWTHMLTNLLSARKNFEWMRDDPADTDKVFRTQAYFVAGVTAYGRCFASSGPGIPMLDAKKVYNGSADGMEVHRRLIELRNTIAAHTDKSDLVRLTLAVKDEPDRVVIRHLSTSALPLDELPDFLEAVAHTEHFVTVSLNKQLDHLETQIGKKIVLD